MQLPQEYVFNKNYSTQTLETMFEEIGAYIIDLNKPVWESREQGYEEAFLDQDDAELIELLSEEADKIEEELNYRKDFQPDINMAHVKAGL